MIRVSCRSIVSLSDSMKVEVRSPCVVVLATSSVIAQICCWISSDRWMSAARLAPVADDPQRDVLAEQFADLARGGLGQVAGPEIRRPDRVRLVQHDPASRVEPVGRHAHRDRQEECQERQDRAHEEARRPFLLTGRPFLVPAAEAEADLVGQHADDREQRRRREDRDRVQQLGEGHRLLAWGALASMPSVACGQLPDSASSFVPGSPLVASADSPRTRLLRSSGVTSSAS